MRKVVVYPGRFQPMLAHHAEVYHRLHQEFPDADVYIGTSNKVELPDSPFNFREKKIIAGEHGIDPNKIVQVRSPYDATNYPFDPENTILIFAVGEKDLKRFPFSNVDRNTGLDMSKRDPNKPAYFQKLETIQHEVKPMSVRGYITLAPTVTNNAGVASASQFRKSLSDAETPDEAKQLYTQQFGQYNKEVFKLIYNKIRSITMNEDLNKMRKLAGLPLMEAAPVDYYGMSEKEKMLADIGRLIMDAAKTEKNDELSNAMAELGGSLADGTISSQNDLVQFIRGVDSSIAGGLTAATKDAMSAYSAGERAGGAGVPAADYNDDDEEDFWG